MSKKESKFNLRLRRDQDWLLDTLKRLNITDLRETDDISLLLHGQERSKLPQVISAYRAVVTLLGTEQATRWVMQRQKYRPIPDEGWAKLYDSMISFVPYFCTLDEIEAARGTTSATPEETSDEIFSVPAQV